MKKGGSVKNIRLEDIVPWAKMKPLRDNPGVLAGMWAKSSHKALVIVIVEVGFAVIGEDPNEFVEEGQSENGPKVKKAKVDKKIPYSDEQIGIFETVDNNLLSQADLLKKKISDHPPNSPIPSLSSNSSNTSLSFLAPTKVSSKASAPSSIKVYSKPIPPSSSNLPSKPSAKVGAKPSPNPPTLRTSKPLPSSNNASSFPSVQSSKPNVVKNLSSNPLKPFLSEYKSKSEKRLEDFRGLLQITKIVNPLFDNERHQLYLSDGLLGIVAKMSKQFSTRVIGGSIKQFDVILVTKTSGHVLTEDLVIVSMYV